MSVWNTVLAHGSGGSPYAKQSLTGIEACRRWGHWWPHGAEVCKDCGEPNPSYPDAGPPDVFPPEPKPARKPRRTPQPSAKATVSTTAEVTTQGKDHS